MCEKCEKLLMDYAELEKEMTNLRKETIEMEQKIAMLYEELAQFKGQIQRENLGSQQSQNPMMENSQNNSTFGDLPTSEETPQNDEFTSETMMMDVHLDQRQQNLANNNDSIGTNIIKRECDDVEMRAYSQFEMLTTSSATLNDEEEGDERNGLQFYDDNFAAGEMDLDDEEEDNGTRMEESDIDGQIKCAPIKIGNILKCNWPGCKHQTEGKYSKYNMSSHWRQHSGERPYVCQECGQSFTHSNSLKRHMLDHTGKKLYKCDVCGKSFKQSSDLANHKRIHTNEKPFICKKCGQSFKQSNGLTNHKRTHTNERPFICKKCGKSFKQSGNLTKHGVVCGKSFKHSESLIDDKLIHHVGHSRMNLDNSMENANATIKRECEDTEMAANFQFQMQQTSSSAALNDEEEEGDERNGLQFYDDNFAVHNVDGKMDLDEDEENGTRMEENDIDGQIKCAPIKIGNIFKCNWPGCEYQRAEGKYSKYKMTSHWRQHSGERPYACTECDKSFSQSGQLRRHERVHTGERPYACTECDKSFADPSNLNKHKRLHTGQRPYACTKCDKSFADPSDFNKHKLKCTLHTGKKPYK